MSGSMYAGHLCATQIGGRLHPHDGDLDDAPILVRVIHGSPGGPLPARRAIEARGSVRLVLRSPMAPHRQWTEDLHERHVVRAEDPSPTPPHP